MAPQQPPLFSPSELAYLHTSLSLTPPIRPDARLPTTFRPLSAETDLLPAANGSARLCFADGTEAIVGVKGEVQKSAQLKTGEDGGEAIDVEGKEEEGDNGNDGRVVKVIGENSWVEVTIDMPGQRDDDNMAVFLGQMIHEGLVADGTLETRLFISKGWHWRLYIDILLLSPPHTYPLPLLSLTTHLALLTTHLPALVSTGDEDPLFNDDWDAALPLYPRADKAPTPGSNKPPITLLVTAVSENIFFDPSREELAVADAVLAVTIAPSSPISSPSAQKPESGLQVLAVRAIDPPSRLSASTIMGEGEEEGSEEGLWKPRRGGVGRALVRRMVGMCVERGGVGEEVLGGLQAFR